MNNSFWTSLFGEKLPTVSYCETPTGMFIERPGYFISNIPYILLGVYLLTQKGLYAKAFGIIAICVGVFSGIYDASYKFNAQLLDLAAMFLLVSFLVIINF